MQTLPKLSVDVRDTSDRVLSDAKVELRPSARRAKTIALKFNRKQQLYLAAEVPAGNYTLAVSHPKLVDEKREIQIGENAASESFILGRRGMRSYQRGRVRVPFEPPEDMVGVLLKRRTDREAEVALTSIASELNLGVEEVPDDARRQGIRLFRLGAGLGASARRALLARIAAHPAVAHAGQLIARRERSVTFLTEELVVAFRPYVPRERVSELAKESGLDILRSVPYAGNAWHLKAPGPADFALLDLVNKLNDSGEVEWAEPNLVTSAETDAIVPTDFLWPGLWDRQVVGTPDAWQVLADNGIPGFGDPDVIIAFVDQGLQSAGGAPSHPEFQGTVSSGDAKVYQLYDFGLLVANNDAPLGDHGMGVAGIGAARGDNPSVVPGQNEGVVGAAPNCRVMGLIFPGSEADQADMYIWAAGFNPQSPRPGFPAPISPGADIFSTSIGFGAGAPISGLASRMLDFLMAFGRGGKGCMCFFSSGNYGVNTVFTTSRPWAAYAKTWGMAASTLANDGVTEILTPYSGIGPVELCAPSHDQYPVQHNPPTGYATWSCDLVGAGELVGHAAGQTSLAAAAAAGAVSITVLDVTGIAAGAPLQIGAPGAAGSEAVMVTGAPNPGTGQVPVSALLNAHPVGTAVTRGAADYRLFGGTSSATPLTAGVGALVLSANPALTWIEAREVMRTSAVKLNAANTDPVGQWLDENGNPAVTSGLPPIFSQWYGYGRVDAAAAVDDAVTFGATRDLVVRDNLADTGATPVGGAFWNSPDIWVRNVDPAVEGAAALPGGYGVVGPHQPPLAGQDNWVYARVHNGGSEASLDAFVRISITHWPGMEFTYPASFVPTNRPGDPVPSPMTPGTYLIGEVAVSGIAPGAEAIVNVLWPEALIPPQTVMVGGMSVNWHPCLLVEVSPHDGPPPAGNHVWDNNNLAQKNISIVYADADDAPDFAMAAVMGHPENRAGSLVLEVDRSRLPRSVELYVDLVEEHLIRHLRAVASRDADEPGHDRCCDVVLLDEARVRLECDGSGDGLVITLPPKARLTSARGHARSSAAKGGWRLEQRGSRTVAMVTDRYKATVPIANKAAQSMIIIVGGKVGPGTPEGRYPVPLLQRQPDGSTSGAVELELVVT